MMALFRAGRWAIATDGTLFFLFCFIGTLFISFSHERELSINIFPVRETLDIWFYLI